jgi:hypothetical protein
MRLNLVETESSNETTEWLPDVLLFHGQRVARNEGDDN